MFDFYIVTRTIKLVDYLVLLVIENGYQYNNLHIMLTLMDFYADWCGPCQAMKPIFEEVMPQYEGKVTLEKVNVDENQQKAQEYGVMSIPTLVLAKDGQEVDRKIGLLQAPMLKQWLDGNLS